MAQDELIALAQKKLQQLQKALILETDTAVKFKLQQEIQALEKQLCGFGVNQVDKSVNGDNHRINIIKPQQKFILFFGVVAMIIIVVLVLNMDSKSSQYSGNNVKGVTGDVTIIQTLPANTSTPTTKP